MSRRKERLNSEVEKLLAQGEEPSMDVIQDPSAISYFLRHYRGRADLAAIVNASAHQGTTRQIEEVRSCLALGDLAAAEICLEKITEPDESGDVHLEWLRLRLFQGRIPEALEYSDLVLKSLKAHPVTVMTCYQLRGNCWIERGQYQQALVDLNRSLILAELFPMAKSATSAAAFLVLAYLGLRQFADAQMAIDRLRDKVFALKEDELMVDRLFILLRTESHFFRATQDVTQLAVRLQEACAVGEWLGDERMLKKSQRELAELMEMEASLEPRSQSAVLSFSNWQLFPNQHLILSQNPKKVFRFKEDSLLDRVLRELVKGPLPMDELFEKVWQLRYSRDRHEMHLRATLSNLRKQLPPGSLVVRNQIVGLE